MIYSLCENFQKKKIKYIYVNIIIFHVLPHCWTHLCIYNTYSRAYIFTAHNSQSPWSWCNCNFFFSLLSEIRRLFDGVVYFILLSIKSTKLILKNCTIDLFTFFFSCRSIYIIDYTLPSLPLYSGLQRKKKKIIVTLIRWYVLLWDAEQMENAWARL